jgi:3-oxoacyl-[acyl-carrier-protein] synthase II
MARRVVITGLGILTPIGKDAATYWSGLAAGTSGVRLVQSFDVRALPTRIAGEILDFDAKGYVEKKDRKQLKVMARAIQLAVAASQLALDDGKVDKAKLDPTRFGVEFGSGLIASELVDIAAAAQVSANGQPGEADLQRWGGDGLPLIMLHNAQGPNNSITESDVAPLLALGESARILRRDQADLFVVGGADSKVNPLSMVRQCLFGNLSRRNDAPEKACRPFEKDRDGVVLGEGAGVLTVEELGHAQKRGAPIYAEMVGFGAAFDRGRTGEGLARAIRAALMQAKVAPGDIDHVNAHALGSPVHDVWEACGIAAAFDGAPPPVWAVKSYVGSLGAGSALTELAASLLALQHGQLPPTLNYEQPDPACPVAVQRQPRAVSMPCFLNVCCTVVGLWAGVFCGNWFLGWVSRPVFF